MDIPKISVVMPVYNGEIYLAQAIESILNQTFSDFEFIIINDGSTDNSGAILTYYEQQDKRIRVYYQENQGVTAARNRGCHLAQGKYIAVADADDIYLPERFARELRYLEEHPEIGVLGAWTEVINENSSPTEIRRIPTAPAVIKWSLIFYCCLVHSSVMMKRDVIERLGFYRPECILAEDYDLWVRASDITRIANLPEILIRYRQWEGGISKSRSQALELYASKITRSMMTQLLCFEVSTEAVEGLYKTWDLTNLKQIQGAASLLRQLHQAFVRANPLNHEETRAVARDAARRFYTLAFFASRYSLRQGFLTFVEGLRLDPLYLFPFTYARLVKIGAKLVAHQTKVM